VGEFSRFGCGIWHWLPFTDLAYRERNLWLAIYTSGAAKRICTGLWHGDHYAMASSASMQVDDVLSALDVLLDRKLVEFDRRLSVLRLTMLPDAGERPGSWKALKGMWSGFNTVPKCAVRDRHVLLMRWLVDQGSKTTEMVNVWAQTFGSIEPPSEASSCLKLSDSDTSTSLQPGLFAKETLLLGSAMTSDSVSIDKGSGTGSGSDPDLDLDQDPEPESDGGRVRLQLVPEETPGERKAREMREVIVEAGGSQFLKGNT
jgi:hypothetical protein